MMTGSVSERTTIRHADVGQQNPNETRPEALSDIRMQTDALCPNAESTSAADLLFSCGSAASAVFRPILQYILVLTLCALLPRSPQSKNPLFVMSYHYQKNEPGGYDDAYDMVSPAFSL